MELLYLTAGICLSIWGCVVFQRGSVFLTAALFIVTTSCCPAELFAINAGGLTWTLDRVCFVMLFAQLAIQWYRNELNVFPLESVDILLGLFTVWLVARTITQPLGSIAPGHPSTIMHLINGYLVPFALYFGLRSSSLSTRSLKPVLWILGGVGLYLSATALFEVTQVWSLVFPKFIGDPKLGIHFGRARGPMLQSVRLGVVLLACWIPIVIFTVWYNPKRRINWLVFLASVPAILGSIYLTYTRSIWMGLATVLVVLVLCLLKGLPRRAMISAGVASIVLLAAIKGPNLIAFKREYSAAETRESTYMRAAFAYVSLEMFKDRPLAGFGFNQFQIYNRDYLADRSTSIRLESIRGYVHHNSFLSLLVDLGLIGFSLYALIGLSFMKQAWKVWTVRGAPPLARGLGLTAVTLTLVHLIQMAFHEVSFSSIENGLLFGSYGLMIAAKRQYCVRPKPQAKPWSLNLFVLSLKSKLHQLIGWNARPVE